MDSSTHQKKVLQWCKDKSAELQANAEEGNWNTTNDWSILDGYLLLINLSTCV